MRKRNQPENHYINKKRPCTTTLKMNLLSSLVLSCLLLSSLLLSSLSSSVFSSLSVPVFFLCLCLSLSLSLSLSPCVVACCCAWFVWCVCFVWCGVWRGLARRKNPPCVDSKRPRVYRHHAHGNTRGRFERTHGDVFSSVKHVIFDIS